MPRALGFLIFTAGAATALAGFCSVDRHVAACGVVLMLVGLGGCLTRA
ncbi:hypothetical protein [Variovorax sp. PMC12]|nr:hypothetical protein [Variovorax sp. PMC12]